MFIFVHWFLKAYIHKNNITFHFNIKNLIINNIVIMER